MDKLKVYIGWDKKDLLAYEVCVRSLCQHASIELEIIPLHDWTLRHKRLLTRPYTTGSNGQMVDDTDTRPFSTDFSFSRFLVPYLENYADEWVMFCDADFMFREDILHATLNLDHRKAVHCVMHGDVFEAGSKFYGMDQQNYPRKGWSSLMILNPSRCTGLTLEAVNSLPGSNLHNFSWIEPMMIGSLDTKWNHLVGVNEPIPNAKAVHFTLGTPDMPGCGDAEYAAEWKDYANKVEVLGTGKYSHMPHWSRKKSGDLFSD